MKKYTTDGRSRGWSFHLCPDKEERKEFGNTWYAPPRWRIHVNTPWFHLAVALTDKAKFAGDLRPHIREQYSALMVLRQIRMDELGISPAPGRLEPWWRNHRDDEQLARINRVIKKMTGEEKHRYPARRLTFDWKR